MDRDKEGFEPLSPPRSSLQPPKTEHTLTRKRANNMANSMLMASSSSKILVPLFSADPARHRQSPPALFARSTKPIATQTLPHLCFSSLKSTATTIATTATGFLLVASPSLAVEMEKAALFTFNLTLLAIMIEFLLLMVALDKIYFTPLGKFMDERDAAIRENLSSVKDTSAEVKQLEDQATAVLRAVRAEISAALNKMKKEMTDELEQKLAEGRDRVEVELAEALVNMERQKEEMIKTLDSQIVVLSNDIVQKVLPVK